MYIGRASELIRMILVFKSVILHVVVLGFDSLKLYRVTEIFQSSVFYRNVVTPQPLTVYYTEKSPKSGRYFYLVVIFQLTLWPWSWTFTVQHTTYVKCEYSMNQGCVTLGNTRHFVERNKRRW